MQLSIKDSDLKGVFNLEVNAIVFLLCKDNIWMSIFSRKRPRFVLFAKFFAQQDPFKGTEVRQWPTYRATAARPLQELQLSQSLLNYHLKPFLNRHYCLSGAVVSRPDLALPRCCDFQSCILCRYLFFMVLKSIETRKAGARPISSQSQFSHAMKNMVVQEQPGPFLQAIFHHVRPWMDERSEEWCNRSICLTGGGADGILCWARGMMKLRCHLTWMKVMAEASWGPWGAPVIALQGFQWEMACSAHHEALRWEQWLSDQYFSLFEGAGQNLWSWRLGSIFWVSMPSWWHLPGCWSS